MNYDHHNFDSVELFEVDVGGSMSPELVVVKLNPTGCWKLEIDHKGNQVIYIQHKDFPFNRWIQEDQIFYGTEPKTYINNCKWYRK